MDKNENACVDNIIKRISELRDAFDSLVKTYEGVRKNVRARDHSLRAEALTKALEIIEQELKNEN